MHPTIFNFFDEICRRRGVQGAVLEIGATPDAFTLLNLPSLSGAKERIGINLDCASEFNGFKILQANANAMTCFPDARFDAVLCNSVLEHDAFFWKTLGEIRRVVRPGGLVAIGTPGYGQLKWERRWRKWLAKIPRPLRPAEGFALQHSTLTLSVHNYPGDYYRFSEQAYRDVFFEGMKDVKISAIKVPPRIIGEGLRA